ncbi:C45 family autoproteolytic acyltransferase/hydrolase [Nonomuraea ferruginea]
MARSSAPACAAPSPPTSLGYNALFAAAGATDGQVRAWGERALERAVGWAPHLADEIGGIAAGAGLEPWQVAVVNARTEILAALDVARPGECSTSVVLPGDGLPPRTVQTWDWLGHLRDAPVLWAYEARPGHGVRTFTEAGALAKIGVNTAGLGVHFNILRHGADGADPGVPVHLIARRILDEAATVEEAADLARSATVSASTVITAVTMRRGRGDRDLPGGRGRGAARPRRGAAALQPLPRSRAGGGGTARRRGARHVRPSASSARPRRGAGR